MKGNNKSASETNPSNPQGAGQIVPINQARSLLGKSGMKMSDESIRALITQLDDVATLLIEMYKVQSSNKPK